MTDALAKPERLRMTGDGKVLEAFMLDWSFVTIIRGPWASGKSTICIAKMYQAAHLQAPDRRGVRRTRWAVVRNTYPDLQETTVKTWLEWFPESVYGPMRRARPFQHIIRVPGLPDGAGRATTVEMEVIFIALDDDEDRKKLLSMELTGAWINEAREISKPIIQDIIGRTGRFPPARDGGHTWSGALMDTNAPHDTHWLPLMMGETPMPDDIGEDERAGLKKPDSWRYFVQPGALLEVKDAQGRHVGWKPNPAAENIANLRPPDKPVSDGFKYYLERAGGNPLSWVRINFCNKLGTLQSGKPVWPTFDREKHVAASVIPFEPALHLYVGLDQTGRNPAAIFGQVNGRRWRFISELVGKDVSREAFAPLLKRHIAKLVAPAGLTIADVAMSIYRDPHDQRDDSEGRTASMIYRQHGLLLIPAPGGNAVKTRTEVIEVLFDNGKITISPNCTRFIAAAEGGYRFRKLKVSGGDFYEDEPDKRNGHADIADAAQYLALGAGEGRKMISGTDVHKPVRAVSGYRPGQGRKDLYGRRRASAG